MKTSTQGNSYRARRATLFTLLSLPALACAVVVLLGQKTPPLRADKKPAGLEKLLAETCLVCHDRENAKGGLDLSGLAFQLDSQTNRERWIQVHDRVAREEMPPADTVLADEKRQALLHLLDDAIASADRAEVDLNGRGMMRRLNREEYEQNLRDLLELPRLDIRDMLPEDREAHGFNKTASVLDVSRVQLAAYFDAADTALREAMAVKSTPPPVTKYRAIGRQLFSETATFGGRQAMFFARDNQAVDNEDLEKLGTDPALEVAIFRSAHWPYYGYPRGFIASLAGQYRVRFSARAVLQAESFTLKPAVDPVPMTFRARKPSGPDVSGDVRATGGWMDIQPEKRVFETTVELLPGETFEFSILGLPVPLARNVDGGPPTYRYPPFPEGGQPGVAIQWLEVEGPIPPESWPPASHRVLFDDLGPEVVSSRPNQDARRLLKRFIQAAAREPVSRETLGRYEKLVEVRLGEGASFPEAMLSAYTGFLTSSHFLYLRTPSNHSTRQLQHFAIASRLSHFLTNTRPDRALMELARDKKMRDQDTLGRTTDRLIASPGFERFILNFTDYWLSLRHIKRNEPDIRLYPEYRFDNYLVESMGRESRLFFTAMVRENLPVSVIVDTDFVLANDRLARHYGLAPLSGSQLRRIPLPENSPYGGLLTQAAVLKVTANGTSTSPVIRGAWIMDRLLGQPPPPPPESVPAVEPDVRGARTIRQLLALHANDERCKACHARFDPVGLALESFDILGAWRTRYRAIEKADRSPPLSEGIDSPLPAKQVSGIDRTGHDFVYRITHPVDTSGRLRDGDTFSDIHDLKRILLANPRQLARNLLHRLIVYSTGTPVRFSDREVIEQALDRCKPNEYRVRDLIHALVQSRIFLGEEIRR